MADETRKPSFMDRLWKMRQRASMTKLERDVLDRTFKALSGSRARTTLVNKSSRLAYVHEPIMRQGEETNDLFVLLDGLVRVRVDGENIASYLSGHLFGEISFLTGRPRSATVWADGRVTVLRIPSGEIQSDKLRSRLWRYAAERMFVNETGWVPEETDRILWWGNARHTVMDTGDYDLPAPCVFVYDGEIQVEGTVYPAPCLVHGESFTVHSTVRAALLPEPPTDLGSAPVLTLRVTAPLSPEADGEDSPAEDDDTLPATGEEAQSPPEDEPAVEHEAIPHTDMGEE